MNTTANATRQPSQDPFQRVVVDAMTERRYPDFTLRAPRLCQVITQSGNACSHTEVAQAWGSGPRRAGHISLCKAHANARYAIDADPSL